MRILTVGNMYPPHHLGGYEQDWAAGVAALREAGHEVRVLTSDHRDPDVTEPDDEAVERTLQWYWRDHEFPRRTLRERIGIERHNRALLEAVLGQFQPDLVSWWAMGGMSLALIAQAKRAGRAAIGVVYDDWMVYGPLVDAWQATWRGPRRPLGPLAGAVTGIPTPASFADAGRWLFASESVRGAAVRTVGPLDDAALLAPGLDEVFLDPAPQQEWRWRLLAPGRLDPRKGLSTAIAALAQLPEEATLTIIGSGDARHGEELKALAAQLHVAERVHFGAARPRPALAAAYAASDAVLFPVVWPEPFGLVPLEAMGIGRPVVASGRGGSGEYLRDGDNCLLHEAEDPAALAAAVRRLAESAELRARLRTGGFQTAPDYARSRWSKRLVAEHEARVS